MTQLYTTDKEQNKIEPIQNVVLKLKEARDNFGINRDWTYTECCIEICLLFLFFSILIFIEPIQNVVLKWLKKVSKPLFLELNLYRMLYWNWISSRMSSKNNLNWTYTECCIEIRRSDCSFRCGKYWTYTECCIEILPMVLVIHFTKKLNLYRMLYWNDGKTSISWRFSLIEPIQNVVLKWVDNPIIRRIFVSIEPIQNVVLKYIINNTFSPSSPHWTYTECCIEIQFLLLNLYLLHIIEPIQNVVLKYQTKLFQLFTRTNWTYTECCIEMGLYLYCILPFFYIEPIQNVVLK